MLRHLPRIRKFAIEFLSISHGERLNRRTTNPGSKSGDCARIQSAAEKHTERDIAHQVAGNTFFQHFTVGLYVVSLWTSISVGNNRKVPIGVDLGLAVFFQLQGVTG